MLDAPPPWNLTVAGARVDIKLGVHRRFLAAWIARTDAARGRTLDEAWRVREACIAALGAARARR